MRLVFRGGILLAVRGVVVDVSTFHIQYGEVRGLLLGSRVTGLDAKKIAKKSILIRNKRRLKSRLCLSVVNKWSK